VATTVTTLFVATGTLPAALLLTAAIMLVRA
jgi:hypothetical protein